MHDAAALFVVVGFALYVTVALFGVGGRLLAVTFPAGAALIAVYLYAQSPATYIVFTWWLWLLTPLVRRVFDLHYGFNATSPLLLAPLFATLVAGASIIRRRRMLRSSAYIPFMVAAAALAYAFLVGVIRQSAFASAYELVTWLAPLFFGVHLALEWKQFPHIRTVFVSAVLWGLLVVSAYGVAQFVNPPIWDRTWVVNAEMLSVGSPVPFVIRIFSTLNAPGPCSVMLVFALLIGLAGQQRWRALALAIGLVALILTKGRSAWGAFVVGAIIMQLRQPIRSLPRQWIAFLVVILLAAPVVTQPRVMGVLVGRAATLRDVKEDNSYQTRVTATRVVLGYLASNPAGNGLGELGGASKLLSGTKRSVALDSGPLEIYATMGWLGGTLFMMSLAAIVVPILKSRRVRFEPVTSAAVSAIIALLLASLFGNIFNGVSGFFFWSAVGLATAGRTFASAVDLLDRYARLSAAGATARAATPRTTAA